MKNTANILLRYKVNPDDKNFPAPGAPELPPPPSWLTGPQSSENKPHDGFSANLPNQQDLVSQMQNDARPGTQGIPHNQNFSPPFSEPSQAPQPGLSMPPAPPSFDNSGTPFSEPFKNMDSEGLGDNTIPPPPGELAQPHPSFRQSAPPPPPQAQEPPAMQSAPPMQPPAGIPYPDSMPGKEDPKPKSKRGKPRIMQAIIMLVAIVVLFFVWNSLRDVRSGNKTSKNKAGETVEQMDFKSSLPKTWKAKKQGNVEGSKHRYFYGDNSKSEGMFVTQSELKKSTKVNDKKFIKEIEKKLLSSGASKLKRRENLRIGDRNALVYAYKSGKIKIETGFVVDDKKQWQFSCQYKKTETKTNCQQFLNRVEW